MFKKKILLSIFIGLVSIMLGIEFILDKKIPQGKNCDCVWDLSQKPFIAYIIGVIFILYGFKVFIHTWKNR